LKYAYQIKCSIDKRKKINDYFNKLTQSRSERRRGGGKENQKGLFDLFLSLKSDGTIGLKER